MTKYSVGPRDDEDSEDDNSSCAMCGSTENLSEKKVAGAKVSVCAECDDSKQTQDDPQQKNEEEYNESDTTSIDTPSDTSSDTSGYTITDPDSSWVEEDRPDYGNPETPYLVPNYVEKVQESVEEKGVTTEEIADETGLQLETVEAVTDGNAVSEGVGKRALKLVENYLEVELRENI